MQPLDTFREADRVRIQGVFADIDDTITSDGHLTADAYRALERLQQSGLKVFPITGRPAGWCDHIARMWPVDGVVGENGAFYFHYDHKKREFNKRYMLSDAERAANRATYASVMDEILAQIPGAAVASDQLYREADLAIDFCEDVDPLDDAQIDQIVAMMEARGMTAKISSIHVNGWFGEYEKLSMTKLMMSEVFNVDLDAEKENFVFVGDSPNDQPMFAFFPHAIGVANLADIETRLASKPTYITTAAAGAGFVEVAAALLAARG
ncbi:MAG: HAD-IIB family hydrolase [Alphaproteobacteria bacterium]|nr:HAD-IIB family hydrolase [Alphaproteobacteria bacterium]MBT7944258.1 HAD-IIB family hydrolase [Alphaproteobacteria bacterium]